MPANFFFYLSKMFFPVDLAMHYPRPTFWISPIGGGMLWLLFLLIPWGLWQIRGRFRAGFFAWMWMVVCWLPVSGIVYVGSSFTADRYSYLMFVGPYMALGLGWGAWHVRHGLSARIVLGVVVVVFAVMTWKQSGVWRNSTTLYTHAIAVQPDDPMIANNYATMLLTTGKVDDACRAYEKASSRFSKEALITFNQGVCLVRADRSNEAVAAYRETLRRDPSHHGTWLNLGLLLAQKPEWQQNDGEAGGCLRSACDLTHWQDSASVLALVDYYIRAGQQKNALKIIGKTMHLKSSNPQHAKLLRRYRDQYRGVMR